MLLCMLVMFSYRFFIRNCVQMVWSRLLTAFLYVGLHVPREISRFTRFIILHGATVKVKVSDTKYRRSPLIQGGLEIPVEVEVQMENSSENQQALSKYQTLVAENYHEPVNGKYVDATPDILKALDCEDELTDFEDEGNEEVDTNTADLDSVVLQTGSGSVPLGSVDVITID